ncbi:hypothetical protein BsIDN1_21830 [Bacillus safensis]|uniref:Uncharacterized protein n=1 Tax=Bacillus safensis TaxID=561879 RepID=A0A5S9M6W5_BACIA|nr:hypothetical protein BsIDN1_21830 [Bacillus safensis]
MKPNETPSHTLQGYPAQSNQQSVYTKKIKKTGCGCGKKKETSIEEKQKPDLSGFLLPFFF